MGLGAKTIMMGYELQGSMLRLAKVAYVHPAGQHLDVIFLDSGEYCRNVQVMSPYAGTDFGFTTGIPEPEKEGWDENKTTDPDKRDIIAVVAYMGSYALCLGFLYPQITQLAFDKDNGRNRMIERSPSDHYRTIDENANFEQYHPGDAWFRVGEGIAHDDLTGKDFDKRWKLKRNKDKVPVITLWNRESDTVWADIQIEKGKIIVEVVNGSDHSKATLIPSQVHVETTGDVLADADGNITANAGVDITANADANIAANAGGNASIDAQGDISATAGGNVDISATGNASVSAAAISANALASVDVVAAANVNVNAAIVNVTAVAANVTAPAITLTGITFIVGDIEI
jgi:hypothetical protein